jgi:thioredoxin-like negative regulator of GroEL
MLRSLIFAAFLGAASAAAGVYVSRWWTPQDPVTTLPAVSGQAAESPSTAEAWPVCTTMDSLAESADWAKLEPDFAAGKRALAAGEWSAAIEKLKSAALRDPANADIQNYIGYAYRRLRQLEPALAYYNRALSFNPRHRAAHEHLGETYLMLGDLSKAEEHLAALHRICLIPCDEYGDLERAIAIYRNAAMR